MPRFINKSRAADANFRGASGYQNQKRNRQYASDREFREGRDQLWGPQTDNVRRGRGWRGRQGETRGELNARLRKEIEDDKKVDTAATRAILAPVEGPSSAEIQFRKELVAKKAQLKELFPKINAEVAAKRKAVKTTTAEVESAVAKNENAIAEFESVMKGKIELEDKFYGVSTDLRRIDMRYPNLGASDSREDVESTSGKEGGVKEGGDEEGCDEEGGDGEGGDGEGGDEEEGDGVQGGDGAIEDIDLVADAGYEM
ncbi:hypothetical protein VF21_05557 [Pseudogymnoascus sp. 05NY08]|nr:hypothetical protein VF21_05557 [Pseudogymnoascus sp. 05NY08]